MPIVKHNPAKLFPQYRNYSHAIEVSGNSRLLFISGLNGYLADGTTMPDSLEEQGETICCQLLVPKWKLEIETIAAAE
jgi:enamine deaminase RidA (YjgF/YER057c/UK114 family)